MAKVYACAGTCGGVVSAEEFTAGKNVCAMKDCPNLGNPLEPREQCASCAEMSAEDGKPHFCEKCDG